MSLNTSLKGRLRNTNLPKSNVLFPLFEAVVNSIHSIDERINKVKDINRLNAHIKINIIRSQQLKTDKTMKPEIVGFEIIDNGIGFNADNYNSFQTLDSEYKIDLGCRGVGRLLWLKAFKKVSVISEFKEGSKYLIRSFDFNIPKDLHKEKLCDSEEKKYETKVQLQQLSNEYVKYLPKTVATIAHALLEHCLWYFLRSGGAPKITIYDDGEIIDLDKEYEAYMLNASDKTSFLLKNKYFEVTHVKLKTNSKNKHSIIYSAADRVVKEESLSGKIPGLFGILKDGDDRFTYMCFVTSDFLTEKVNPERMGFNISEATNGLFANEEITFGEIRQKVIKTVSDYLEQYLKENKLIGIKKVTDFVTNKAPRYRPILRRISENDKVVDPNISDKDLELKLHAHLMEIESELLKEGHDLMQPTGIEDKQDYYNRIEAYLSKSSDIKKSDLANYVAHRKVILDLFGKALDMRKDGKYSKEDVIHKLIMPMQSDSNELFFDDSNLWLIDERLAFHNFLASDKTINSMPITQATSTKEPDLMALNVYDNPILVNNGQSLPLASITVVEIKRPMRNDAKQGEDKDPIEQALGYLERVRQGKVKTFPGGRPIPNSESIPGYCYVVCDLTDTMKKRCKLFNLTITADKMGYFGYNENFKSYIEVISFDRLLAMAKERNRAFFDKLGLPTN